MRRIKTHQIKSGVEAVLEPNLTRAAVEAAVPFDADALRELFEEAKELLEAGQADQALVPLREILAHCPDHPDALNFASVAFGRLDMAEEAERFSRRAIAARPDDAGFHLNLANRLKDQDRIDEALEAYERALTLDPGHLSAQKSRLRCLVADERWPDVKNAVDHLLAHIDAEAELLVECADACIRADDHKCAFDLCKRALDAEPDNIVWLLLHARLAMRLGRSSEARTTGEHVLELTEHPEMRCMLASIMQRLGDFEAMEAHLDAVPDDSEQAANAANLRGMMLASQGKIREGVDHMARTETLEPDAFPLQATRVMYLNYDPTLSAAAIRDKHIEVGRHFADTLPPLDAENAEHLADPDRRLRIGFVSPDLRGHSVAYFIRPYFEAFDRDRFELFAYAHVANEDSISVGLREQVTCWRNVFDLGDQALARRIQDDRIDILIDLAGYTKDNRLLAMTARPAPIQMTWIGYPNTTGMPAMDYRITDGTADPEGAEYHFSETLIRLPGCFLCYAIPNHAPPVEPGPAEHRDHVTFGSFNNFAKINDEVVALWADILKAVPNSKLLCKSTSSADATAQQVVRKGLQQAGVDPSRVDFTAFRQTAQSHLAVYNDIDIALDSFPYNGTTTTCEALWMGVPVVTLRGDRHAGRVGASLLTTIGFEAGIAETRNDYVLTARLLAENPGLLKTARRSLRDTVMRSPLCDRATHARNLEEAFRAVWRYWCEDGPDAAKALK